MEACMHKFEIHSHTVRDIVLYKKPFYSMHTHGLFMIHDL